MHLFVLLEVETRLRSSDNFLRTVPYPRKGSAPWHPLDLLAGPVSSVGRRLAAGRLVRAGSSGVSCNGLLCLGPAVVGSTRSEPGETAPGWIALCLLCLPLGLFIESSLSTSFVGQVTIGLSFLGSPRRQLWRLQARWQGVMDGEGRKEERKEGRMDMSHAEACHN